VHRIDLEISEEGMRALRRKPKEYVEGAVAVDGERFESVGVRLKGSGSFQDLNGKSSFKVDFNRYIPDQSYHGKGKLTLNNMLHDSTQVHEVVAHAAFKAAGLPASRVGYAWVTVNGADYGLYSNVETPDRDYLERNFGQRDGNLFEGGYPYYPDSWDHADFTMNEVENFELESGTDVQWADLKEVVAALNSSDLEPALAEVVDIDGYARFQIMEAWTGQWDGYAFASNNFRIYFDHGQTDRMYMVPAGLDYCFTEYGGRLARASSPLGATCQADAVCRTHYAAVLEDTLDRVDAAELHDLMTETFEFIEPWIAEDFRNSVQVGAGLDAQVDSMGEWIDTRSVDVRRWYSPE
jgi:spore coat protein CotH